MKNWRVTEALLPTTYQGIMLSPRYKADGRIEAGIDEAGRGCFWGPMVAAAVIWPEESTWSEEVRKLSAQIKDSKRVTPKRRAVLFEAIQKHAVAWGIGRVEPAEIDELGMTETNRLGFARAIGALSVVPERLLIDGCLYLDTARFPQEQVVEPKADGTYLAVAAASILAKEGRDRMVIAAGEADPDLETKWAIVSSKGYGTSKHSEGIKTHGLHSGHRRLFLRNLLGREIHQRAFERRDICLLQD